MNEDKAVRYHRLKRRAAVASMLVSAAVPAALLATGGARWLADGTTALAGGSWLFAAGLCAVALVLLHEAAQLPLACYSSLHIDRRYGLSSESTAGWALDHLKALAVTAVFASGAAALLYALLRTGSVWWWLAAAAGGTLATIVLTRLFPTLLLPWFYRFRPLDRPELLMRLEALSRSAGVPVVGVFEWGLGDKSRAANAAVVGLGGSRRILLSDTLLAGYNDDEIEVILAHELAHHVHRDIAKALALEGVLLAAAFGAADVALRHLGPALGLDGRADLAGMPLVVLAAWTVFVLATPLLHAFSRANERRADEYALRITGRPGAFASAMRRLSVQNLSEPDPSRLALWFFHSHPPVHERIQAAGGAERSPAGPPGAR